MTQPCCSDMRLEPFELLTGRVETEHGAKQNGPKPSDLEYEASGHTQVHWDDQRTIGQICSECGAINALDEEVVIGERPYRLKDTPAESERELPFLVGNNDGKVARFATLGYAEEFIRVLQEADPTGVERGDYYIDGPEVLFAVKADGRYWIVVDQDGDVIGRWDHDERHQAEKLCRELNEAVRQ